MRILACHTQYQQLGGEDISFGEEVSLLRSRGHEVIAYVRHNDELNAIASWRAAAKTMWNRQAGRDVAELIRRHRPDVVHCNNTFPLLSPSIYYAARRQGVPVVQSLRNYRLMCVNGLLFREGRHCERCLCKPFPWPGIMHRCYRDSMAASAVVATMLGAHWYGGTFTRMVDLYVALVEGARQKYIEAGIDPDRVCVKPNFLANDPGMGPGDGGYALYVGRLSPEKGIGTLLEAWRGDVGGLPLKIIGDGPMSAQVRQFADGRDHVQWLGQLPLHTVQQWIGRAACLVLPSIWHEAFGRTMIEAYASGTPVVASRIGAMDELVTDGGTGRLFQPGDASDLAAKVRAVMDDPPLRQAMRRRARAAFEQHYTADRNYAMLMAIYERARANALRRAAGQGPTPIHADPPRPDDTPLPGSTA